MTCRAREEAAARLLWPTRRSRPREAPAPHRRADAARLGRAGSRRAARATRSASRTGSAAWSQVRSIEGAGPHGRARRAGRARGGGARVPGVAAGLRRSSRSSARNLRYSWGAVVAFVRMRKGDAASDRPHRARRVPSWLSAGGTRRERGAGSGMAAHRGCRAQRRARRDGTHLRRPRAGASGARAGCSTFSSS